MKPLIIAGLFASIFSCSILAAENQKPNILIIMTDDQSHDTLTPQFMPNTKSMIADQGLNCTQFLMSTAICCPSRSSFLTGQYARHHGVHGNRDPFTGATVADRLHEAGYFTGLIGKYLNSWPGDARPEYDYWAAWISGYVDPKMNVFGKFQNVPGYLTYIQRDYALDFLGKVPKEKPFFLLFTPHAPHDPATPAPGDENLFRDLPQWRPPNFNPVDQSDKPNWLANTPQLSEKRIRKTVDVLRLKQLQCLHSVDITVRDILNKLRQQGKLDNTFIVFYSDNGYFWGEHRLRRKDRVYEEASHGPFAIRYPPLIEKPRIEGKLVGVIDLAPTIYELAGIPAQPDVDGRSLVPLMRDTGGWRDAILLEGWPISSEPKPQDKRMKEEEEFQAGAEAEPTQTPKQPVNSYQDYRAIRTKDYVYVETEGDKSELYDLKADPYEMHNLIGDPKYADRVKQLSYRLHHDKL